jgi:hypothetical protein
MREVEKWQLIGVKGHLGVHSTPFSGLCASGRAYLGRFGGEAHLLEFMTGYPDSLAALRDGAVFSKTMTGKMADFRQILR